MSANLPYTQNQKWAKDSGGFGFRMLAKMGWTEGKGLGKKEDGAVTHVRVKKRAEQLALGAEGVVDMTGNASLVGAVQDFNTLLSQLSAVGTGAGGASASSGGARVMKRIAYHKVLRSKDAASYSARDLASIVVGAAYPDTAPPPAAAAPAAVAAAASTADVAAGLKRRRRSMSEASVASAPSVRSTRSTTRRAAAAAAVTAPAAAADAGGEKAAKAARKRERQARREAKAERAAKREARKAAAAAEAEASD